MKTTELERAILLVLKMHGHKSLMTQGEVIASAQNLVTDGEEFPSREYVFSVLCGLVRHGLVRAIGHGEYFKLTPGGWMDARAVWLAASRRRYVLDTERGTAKPRRDAAGERKPVAVAVRLLEAGGSLCRAVTYVSAAVICAHVAKDVICRAW